MTAGWPGGSEPTGTERSTSLYRRGRCFFCLPGWPLAVTAAALRQALPPSSGHAG
ncbi:hypothetical protein [Paenibacillus dendritiformis]|uniref:hypothetical protein n=1 Tax=Paenibacillus dendritiformis TaxID=130049 RepID=UPI0020C258E8|nr:hypothetical protein [Paenibacillus dendritiformis]CAH8767544.1 hypothetical protein H7S4_000214 [Paenibacillus dendritiformis]